MSEMISEEMMDITMIDKQMTVPRKGEVRQATVVSVRKDAIIADIGYKSEGIIVPAELAWPIPDDCREFVKNGDSFPVMVIGDESGDGLIKLSKSRAEQIAAWDKIAEASANKEIITSKVTAKVKGGLTVAVNGIRGFIPAKQVDIRFVEDLDAYIGQDIEAVIIEFDRAQRKLVLSRRQILQEERDRLEQAAFAALAAGQTVKGTVVRLADFGAFVDIGGIDGLVHINDLAWQKVKKPADVISVGDVYDFLVVDVNPERKRIALSLKAMLTDPWQDKVEMLAEGQITKGRIVSVTKFGAFINLVDGVDGLLPLKEIESIKRSEADNFVAGSELNVKIISIDKKRKRIALSVTELEKDIQRAQIDEYMSENKQDNVVTIGEKFSDILGKIKIEK